MSGISIWQMIVIGFVAAPALDWWVEGTLCVLRERRRKADR